MKKRNAEITNWVKANCDPNAIPTFLLEEGLVDGSLKHADIVSELNRQAKTVAMSFIEKDMEIQNFLNLLKTALFKKDGKVARGGVCYLNLSHFIFSDELKKALLHEYDSIKGDERRLAALALIVEETFPELWNYNPGGTNNNMWVINGLNVINQRFKQFLMLMNPTIEDIEEAPNKDSTGAYSYYYFHRAWGQSDFSVGGRYFNPIKQLEERFEGDSYIHFRHGDGPDAMKQTLSFEVFVAYGLEQAEIIYKNLLLSYDRIEESSKEGYKQRILDEFCRNRFAEVKDNPEIMSVINTITAEGGCGRLLNCDFDIDHGIIVYIDGRSEHGRSGGVGQISQVIIWHNGQREMREFTYRDRYSGSNDNYAYDFRSVKIIDLKEKNETLEITVKAEPKETRFSSTRIDFRIPVKTTEGINQ